VTVSPPASAGTNIVQGLVVVPEAEKRDALLALIKSQDVKNALVFCNRKRDVALLHTSLKKHGVNAAALHGDMSQPARTETLERFKAGEIQILVASDVAARGLDIVDMSHVFNFDVPFSPEDYVHRIGGTGRAGKIGHSFTLASPSEGDLVQAIEKLIGTTIPRIEIPGLEATSFEASDGRRRGRGGRRGGRSEGGRGGAERSRGPRREPREHREPRAEASEAAPAAPVERAPREQHKERPPREHRPSTVLSRGPSGRSASVVGAPSERGEPRQRPATSRVSRSGASAARGRDEGAPVGLGDHVPAFLARSPR
jgi:superfamily II DNA/RNA helicase